MYVGLSSRFKIYSVNLETLIVDQQVLRCISANLERSIGLSISFKMYKR